MGAKDYLARHRAADNVKAVEIDGITVHIRRLTIGEASQLERVTDDAERIRLMLMFCLVDEDGTPELTEADADLIMQAEGAAVAELIEAIGEHNSTPGKS